MQDCIFCKIIKGEIPSSKVYEDNMTFAFLDLKPVNLGHILVVPKEHSANIYETPDAHLEAMIKTAKKVSIAVKKSTNADGVNLAMNNNHAAGQVIFHSHFHIIPRYHNDGFELWHGKREYKNEEEMKELAEKIQKEINPRL